MTVPLLEQLRVELQNDSISAVIKTTDELREAFTTDRARTERIDTLATAVRYRAETGSPAAEAANDHLEKATELEERRVELTTALLNYVAGEGTAEDALQRIDPTIGAYRELQAARDALKHRADDVPLGVILSVGEVAETRIPKEDTETLSTSVVNIGDSEAGPLDVTVSLGDSVSVDVSPDSIGSLAADSERSISVELTGLSTSQERGRIVVAGERRESSSFRVEVVDKVGFVSEALSITERLLEDIRTRDGGKGRSPPGIQNRLGEINRRLDRISDQVQEGKVPEVAVNKKIESVINQFESLIQTLKSAQSVNLSERVILEYVQLCENAIDVLKKSIRAAR